MDILINNLDVRYFKLFLDQSLTDGYIQKIQTLQKFDKGLKIKIKKADSNLDLIVANGAMFITKYNYETSEKNNFVKILNTTLKNEKIISITQKDWEKIIIFETRNNYLIFELFSHNNIILTDKNYNIIACLIKEIWDKREIKVGKTYLFPQSEKIDPTKITKDYKDPKDLIKEINTPPALVEFLNKRNLNLGKELKRIYSSNILFDSTYLIKTKKMEYFPIELQGAEKINKSLNSILDDYYFSYVDKQVEGKRDKIKELTITLKKINDKIQEFETASAENSRAAAWIEQNYDSLNEIKAAVERGLASGKKTTEILHTLAKFKDKYPLIKYISGIDLKNKKIIFSIPQSSIPQYQQ